MGFWDELKQLGKDIGDEFSTLGSELKEIGKNTVEEIKQDPKKYLAESAKEIATAAVSAGKFVVNEGIPRMTSQMAKEMEKKYQENQIPPEQRKAYEESRRNGFEKSKQMLETLIGINESTQLNQEDLEKKIRRIEKAVDQLIWYKKLPNLGVEDSAIYDAKQLISRAEQHIKDLQATN